MSRVVLSIGSNLGDRRALLQAAVDGLGEAVRAVSPVYETDPWGGVEQGPFLNAVVIAENHAVGAHDWLNRAHALESANHRIRVQKWGPRSLDVDLIKVTGPDGEVTCADEDLTLPHPFAHRRAFVLVPWLAVDPEAELTADGRRRPVAHWVADLDQAERDAVRETGIRLTTAAGLN